MSAAWSNPDLPQITGSNRATWDTRAGVVGTSHCRDRTGSRAAEHHPEARAYHVRQQIFLVHENGCTRDLGIAYRAASTHTALRRAPLR